MSGAFNHKVWRLTPKDLADVCSARGGDSEPARMRCGAPNCQTPFTCFASYRYVTGRAGRVTRSVREYCDRHAAAFAKKNNLEAP